MVPSLARTIGRCLAPLRVSPIPVVRAKCERTLLIANPLYILIPNTCCTLRPVVSVLALTSVVYTYGGGVGGVESAERP